MQIDALCQEGYQLLQEGAQELARVEANGIRIDMRKLEATKVTLLKRCRDLKEELIKDDIWRQWRRRFGSNANLTSDQQLAEILYGVLGYEVTDYTESGKPSTDSEALQKIDNPFVQKLSRFSQYDKALGTFLKGIEREVVNGRLHPVFNLHTVKTYRSSSDSPNFQNFPVRDKEIAEIIRSLFIPSTPHHVIPENDFKGIEVAVSACYHHDENFISYITTPGKDMHRDMAAQIYCLDPSEVSKDARYGAKNKFVFPQFYGDFYVSCAKTLWEWLDKGKLMHPNGMNLKQYLKTKGIMRLGDCNPDEKPKKGTFEKHVQEVEDDFWNHRFMQYGQWRKDWYRAYLEKGYFDLLSGFRVHGSFRRNQVTNFPVQGAAFHCLLWTLIQVNRLLRKYKMQSMVVGQIHDSMLGDVPGKELQNYWEIVEDVVTVQLRKHYEWLVVPLEVEYEIVLPGGNWFQKKEAKFRHGRFVHPSDPTKTTTNAEAFFKIMGATK
jgi:DNA polymerase I-like protein with 3'-5' exonuclease and polymerase domains